MTDMCRFMMVPRKEMEKELKVQEKELTDDITNLNKKVCTPPSRRRNANCVG
jgi:hypothetical protein